MPTSRSRFALFLSAILCTSAGVARAETPTSNRATSVDALQQARESLTRYDLDGSETLAQLQALAVVAVSDPDPAHAQEARFLRAAAAADLIVIATELERPMLLDALASTLSCERGALFAAVEGELQAAAVGQYAGPARDALATLQHIAGHGQLALPAVSVLRDFEAVQAAAQAAHSRDPSAALAALGDDPCSKADGACALSGFDAGSRRSLAALTNAAGANASIQRAADHGDPLARALAERAAEHAAALDSAVVCAVPELNGKSAKVALPRSLRTAQGASTLALRIGASEARTLLAPCLALRTDSAEQSEHVELAWSTLALPASYRPYITPIAGLGDALSAQIHEATVSRVVVMADAGVQAHVLARALVSLPAATSGARVSLLTPSGNGELRARPVEIARSEGNAPAVHVRIRLGGYSLYVGDHFEDIPRVKTSDGFSFDHATLEQRLASQPSSAVQISFMSEVPSNEVLAALSTTAQRSERIQLMIP